MLSLLEDKIVIEKINNKSITYTLFDDSLFNETSFKVMNSKLLKFVYPSYKLLFNGHLQFYYLLDNYISLNNLILDLSLDDFLCIYKNLLAIILNVKNDSYLNCNSIMINRNTIFVDIETKSVKIIYLPIEEKETRVNISLDRELRHCLINLIPEDNFYNSPKIEKLTASLMDNSLSLKDIYNLIDIKTELTEKIIADNKYSDNIRLVSINNDENIEIIINKTNFIIGTSLKYCDAIIKNNKTISRQHCKIVKEDGQWQIFDLNSSNGTYINGIRLKPSVLALLNSGDVIKLSNVEFEIKIE